MTTDPLFPIDPDTLATALTRPAADIDEPSAAEVAWAAAYGPGSTEDALRILASAGARRLLTHEWDQQCPSPDLLDAAVAAPDANEDTQLHAHAVHTLLNLHTRTCTTCAHQLQALQNAVATLDEEFDEVTQVLHRWTLSLTLTLASTPVRGDEHTDRTLRQELDDPDRFQTLTGRSRTETDRWPTLTVTTTATGEHRTRVHARLIVPPGVRPELTVAVSMQMPTGELHLPLHPSDRDRITLTGDADTSTMWEAGPQLDVQLIVSQQ